MITGSDKFFAAYEQSNSCWFLTIKCAYDFCKTKIANGKKNGLKKHVVYETRPDTRLPQSRAGGQGPYLRSVEHLGRSGIAKNPINAEKVKCDSKV